MTEQTTSAAVTDILVFDTGGYGYVILTTLDGVTWLNFRRRTTLNEYQRNQVLERLEREQPWARVHCVRDSNCRIPAYLLREGARVI